MMWPSSNNFRRKRKLVIKYQNESFKGLSNANQQVASTTFLNVSGDDTAFYIITTNVILIITNKYLDTYFIWRNCSASFRSPLLSKVYVFSGTITSIGYWSQLDDELLWIIWGFQRRRKVVYDGGALRAIFFVPKPPFGQMKRSNGAIGRSLRH